MAIFDCHIVLLFCGDYLKFFLQVGAADYIAIARNYHTVFISGIPTMSMKIRDKVICYFLDGWVLNNLVPYNLISFKEMFFVN